jgi:hypothetical protein
MMVLFLITLLAMAPAPARADEHTQAVGLVTVGSVLSAVSGASGAMCGFGTSWALGTSDRRYDSVDGVIGFCVVHAVTGAAGIAMTVVGGRRLQQGRALRLSLNGVSGRF